MCGGLWVIGGKPWPVVFWIAIVFPVEHQFFVWWSWRTELANQGVSRKFGFATYLVVFFTLFLGRFVSLFALAWIDAGSLGLNGSVAIVLCVLLAVPGFYAMYSVHRYFGMARAAGADHFDPAYRNLSMVDKGIFRFTSNGMYIYAFLLFWAIAFGFNSWTALLVAGFSHLYIWVHFFATEKPDMEFIYGSKN